ncbi:NAD(P)/FAD-dependent oxidoreductase [Spongiibacter sp. KMU-158]|uniref:NAD(P)/FAD-dependent oxidoreductase n=1 Tax=Spongiibacter pelagi TaxID=2760804 RepID=A0A927C099_9GAMM|nr:NAD(P)/FAD-dependent oxidoreductase [Spongiibacter pelagi]MBD2858883.1 NAD(P)/FAD-dependent oxidoreductase [Spongiibacter pelagi]
MASAQSAWQPRIAIIGAGISGIAAVVKLRKAGFSQLTVFEKADKVGGTWRENTYPGLACDIPSHWYSFSFEPNPDWHHRCAHGPEIQAYLERTAQKYGVTDIVRFNSAVTRLVYQAPHWLLYCNGQNSEPEQFDIVISATGILHRTIMPAIPGLDDFAGASFHSAHWDHSVDYHGKRIGVIGTGSTSCQIVGAVTKDAQHLTLFQRTAQWVMPSPQKAYSNFTRWLRKVWPFRSVLSKVVWRAYAENTLGRANAGNKALVKLIDVIARWHLKKYVPDPVLRAKLTPDYVVGCKRLIYSSDFYPAISRENASVVTEGIERIEAEGVRTNDGVLHPLDILVLATGFDASSFILPTQVIGENGQELSEVWDGSPRAHRAVAMPGFPNFWMVEGPTGPIGNFSLIAISESQVDYIIRCLNEMHARKSAWMAPTQEAFKNYNEAMNAAVVNTSWYHGGCNSWYLDKSGLPNLYPWLSSRYFKEMKTPDFSEFRFS